MKPLRRISLAMLLSLGCSSTQAAPAADTRRAPVSAADFFFYSCVNEYMKAHAVPLFDGSSAYGVEYSRFSAAVLERLHAAARLYALSLRAPDYADPEHGSPAVLMLCQQASRKPAVGALAKPRTDD